MIKSVITSLYLKPFATASSLSQISYRNKGKKKGKDKKFDSSSDDSSSDDEPVDPMADVDMEKLGKLLLCCVVRERVITELVSKYFLSPRRQLHHSTHKETLGVRCLSFERRILELRDSESPRVGSERRRHYQHAC